MNQSVRVAACQVQDIREDVDAALTVVVEYATRATAGGADLVCFPECYLQGYLLQEETAREHAIDLNSAAFAAVLKRLASIPATIVLGLIEQCEGRLFNTAVVVEQGRLAGRYRKSRLLPHERFFHAGSCCPVFEVRHVKFGVNICYDTQSPESAAAVASTGARLIVCPANNMMNSQAAERWKDRHNEVRRQRVKETGLWLVSSDVTGTHGNSIGLGPTAIIAPDGRVVAQVPLQETGIVTAKIPSI